MIHSMGTGVRQPGESWKSAANTLAVSAAVSSAFSLPLQTVHDVYKAQYCTQGFYGIPHQSNEDFIGIGALNVVPCSQRQIVSSVQPSQIDPIVEFREYDVEGWDGEGALPITKATRDAARMFLVSLTSFGSSPYLAPGADGSIGMEWESSLGKLWVDVGPGSKTVLYARLKDDKPIEKSFISTSPDLVELACQILSTLFAD